MYQASVRSTTAGTAKTALALVAIFSLMLSLFAIASPAAAATEHCGGGNSAPSGAINVPESGASGSVVVDDTTVYYVVDGRTISFYADAAHETALDVSFCVKASTEAFDDLEGSTYETDEHDISYFVIYEVLGEPDHDETVTVIKDLVGDTEGTFDLRIDGEVEASGVGDGGTTGAVVTDEGSVTVSESAAGETDLDDYTTSISCTLSGSTEVLYSGTGTSLDFTLADDQDVVCTITNTLIAEENGELEIDKFACTGDEDETIFFVFGPFSAMSEPDTGDCGLGANVTFSVYTDAGEGVAGDFVLSDTTDADGIIEVPLPAGDYVLVEGAEGEEGPSQAFTVEAGATTAIVVLNVTGEGEGEEETGEVKILKFLCEGDDDEVVFFEEGDESAPDTSDCEVADATFTIDDGDEFSTENGGALLTVAADEEHTLTEVSPLTGSTTFTVDEGDRVTIIVVNYEDDGEGEDESGLKVMKFYCDDIGDDVIFTIVEGSDLDVEDVDEPEGATDCRMGDAAFTLDDGDDESDIFNVGPDGVRSMPLDAGEYALSEVRPNEATSDEFDVAEGETTTVVVFNPTGGGEGPGEGDMVEVSIMKHLCTDVATVDEFEAVEAAAAEENPDNAFAPLVATVLACPTIVLTGDVPTEGAISGGEMEFEFSVLDADGDQLLSEDGMFMQAALCETDVNLDADGDGEITADVCLDVSHYSFEVVDGLVVITESDAPDGHRLGTIRFTPGSDDADALVGSIDTVEATGVITLDTEADGDDAVMIHAYNFVNEGTQGGNPPGGGEGPGVARPGEGTLGGNPLPDTAVDGATGIVPAAVLALLMLSGLGAAAYAVRAEAVRRR